MVNINRQYYKYILLNLKRLKWKETTCIRSKHACFYLSMHVIYIWGKVCSLVEPVAISYSAFCYDS